MEAAGFELRCQIIWAKNTFRWGFGRYKFQHEPIFYTHVAGQKDPWYGDKSQSTLWNEKKPAANRIYPTAKPVELVERAIVNRSKAGDLVADFFGGSGSTLIGCERLGRNARLMEIDPKYVDVIIRRWQAFTGKQATPEGDERTFDEIAEERTGVAAIERCRREIAAIEDLLRAGHPDMDGLLLALADWSAELEMVRAQRKKPPVLNSAAIGVALG